jgi:hypothetical protein
MIKNIATKRASLIRTYMKKSSALLIVIMTLVLVRSHFLLFKTAQQKVPAKNRRKKMCEKSAPRANPTTFQFTATAPALYIVGYSFFQTIIKYFMFSKRDWLRVAF